MPQNHQKPQQWNDKYDAFCLAHCIPPAAKLLWQWLHREGQLGEDIEPDLTDFNKWVEKHRGRGYSHPTLKNALGTLVGHGVVSIIRKFSWKVYRLLVKPLDWLKPKRNFHKREETYTLQHSNQLNDDVGDSSSSNSYIPLEDIPPDIGEPDFTEDTPANKLAVVHAHGIPFNPDKSEHLLRYSLEDICAAVGMFLFRGGHQKIKGGGCGWIIECLRKRYWEDDSTMNKQLRYGAALNAFVEDIALGRRVCVLPSAVSTYYWR